MMVEVATKQEKINLTVMQDYENTSGVIGYNRPTVNHIV